MPTFELSLSNQLTKLLKNLKSKIFSRIMGKHLIYTMCNKEILQFKIFHF